VKPGWITSVAERLPAAAVNTPGRMSVEDGVIVSARMSSPGSSETVTLSTSPVGSL
jgi:hypothetical protein